MSQKDPKIEAFLREEAKWREPLERLRAIALDCDLTEEVKWGKLCYSHAGGNIVILQGFKDYCALLFFKGALLKDPRGILIQQTVNVQSGRQLRFTRAREVVELAPVIKAYIEEAVAVEKAGLKVKVKQTSDFPVPEELRQALAADPALKTAFEALTPGRQRAYLFHFAAAKQSKTRAARVAKCRPQILRGKGLND